MTTPEYDHALREPPEFVRNRSHGSTGLNHETAIAIDTTRHDKVRRSFSRDELCLCPPHYFQDIEQMIEMRVSDEHSIRAGPDMLHAEGDSSLVRSNSLL